MVDKEFKIGDKVTIAPQLKNIIGTTVDGLKIVQGMDYSKYYNTVFEIYNIDKIDNSVKLIINGSGGYVMQSYRWPISYLIKEEHVNTELKIGDKVKINQALKNNKNTTVDGLPITGGMADNKYYIKEFEIFQIDLIYNSVKLISRNERGEPTIQSYDWPLSYLIKKEVSRFDELVEGDLIRFANKQEFDSVFGSLTSFGYKHKNGGDHDDWNSKQKLKDGSVILKIERNKKYWWETADIAEKDISYNYIQVEWLLNKTEIKYINSLKVEPPKNKFNLGDRVIINSSLRKTTTIDIDGILINDDMKTNGFFYNKEWKIMGIHTNSVMLRDDEGNYSGYNWPISYIRKVIDLSGSQGFNGIPSSSNPLGEIYLSHYELSKTESKHIIEEKGIKIVNSNKLSINKSKQKSYDSSSIKIQGSNLKISNSDRIRGAGLTSARIKI